MKKTYLVTERAGRWIAGQRVANLKDGRIELSVSQAAYELALGTITLLSADEQSEPEKKTKRRKAGQTSEAPAWNETQRSASTLIE